MTGGHAWRGGGHVWQGRWPLQRTARILLECIFVDKLLKALMFTCFTWLARSFFVFVFGMVIF